LALTHVTYLEALAENLPLPDHSCDSVLFLQSLQYVSDPAQALSEAVRVLAVGGRLLVVTVNQHQFPESERYGHRHRGFQGDDLKRWSRGLGDFQLTTLPPETRPPRFQTLILSGTKPARPEGRPARGRA
jgi:ubiquinone/menaquinone biosynthesis C-methylase UbiE